jgi:hypothetical protein
MILTRWIIPRATVVAILCCWQHSSTSLTPMSSILCLRMQGSVGMKLSRCGKGHASALGRLMNTVSTSPELLNGSSIYFEPNMRPRKT